MAMTNLLLASWKYLSPAHEVFPSLNVIVDIL